MSIRVYVLLAVFLLCLVDLPAEEPRGALERLIFALGRSSGVLEAQRDYENALIEGKYRHLQWWTPSFSLSNDYIYPYEHDKFDDRATSNTSSFAFTAPLPTGSLLELSASYGLSRELLPDMLPQEQWGFAQDLQGKIGFGQSLNPWWLHTGRSPYAESSALKESLAKNSYNSALKTALFSCVESYIALRKAERNRDVLVERIVLYDDMLIAYRQMRDNGRISWQEFQDVRRDKWEDEESFFTLEQNIHTLKGEIFTVTGAQIGSIKDEPLIPVESPLWPASFLAAHMEDLRRLEETSIQFEQENLRVERLINRQSNAPLLKVELGSSVKFPVKETEDLGDAWNEDNFTDNILNNWALTISLDLSSLFSPLNKKNEAAYRLSRNILDNLLKNVREDKEREKIRTMTIVRQLEEHIARLRGIIEDEERNIQDDKLLFEQGALTELEYRQSLLEYKSKCTLLENFTDELWMYELIAYFYLR
jgi:hypothetical protein